MRLNSALVLGAIVLASALPALGAEPGASTSSAPEEQTFMPRIGFNIAGGPSIPFSDAGNRFKTGGGFELGATYYFTNRVGIQAEYLYSSYGVDANVLESSGVHAHHDMQYGDINVTYHLVRPRPVGVYLAGGPGLYYRRVDITEIAGTAVVPYCDPWLFVCYSEPVPVEAVLGTRHRTDFGLNAGLGVELRLFGGPMRVYAEGRYHYIFSGSIDTPAGSKSATGQYLPIMFGLRL